jgi:hypothetical protein
MNDALAPVLRQINAAHGTAFVLGARFPRGGHGAFRLRDAAGGGRPAPARFLTTGRRGREEPLSSP